MGRMNLFTSIKGIPRVIYMGYIFFPHVGDKNLTYFIIMVITTKDLRYALENGIIDRSHLQGQIFMYRRKEILDRHPYKIYYSSDGRWATYLPDEKKKRRLVKRKNKDDLYLCICEFYGGAENVYTFLYCYKQWRKYRDLILSEGSIRKYDSDFLRYFDGEKFLDLPIDEITRIDVETFIFRKVKDLHLCKSAAKTLYHYVDNTICFAREKEITENYPTQFLSAKNFYGKCVPSSRSYKPRCLDERSIQLILEKLSEDHVKHPDYIPAYAVEFAYYTGMRVGEIAALMWKDVKTGYILVSRSQKWDAKSSKYYLDDTKNRIQRQFPITKPVKMLLNSIKLIRDANGWTSEFIFSDEKGELNFRTICSCLKNKCRQLGIETVGIHIFRRTLNSRMAASGVPVTVRASLLGHSMEVNEQYYTYDTTSLTEKERILNDIFA